MIAQLLNRQFILEQLEEIQGQLAADVEQRRENGAPGAEDLRFSDYEEALRHVQVSVEREKRESSGQTGFVPPPDNERRRGEEPTDLDEFSFLSRDPVVNAVQSALEYYFDHPDCEDKVTEEEPADDRRRGDDDEPMVTNRSLQGYQPRREVDGRRIFDKFSVTDGRWVSALVAMGVRMLRKQHAFNESRPRPVEICDRARVILVGDWGSGIPRAQKVATAMRVYMEQGTKENREVQVIHLGDVYYAGWKYEYEKRFLRYWPVRAEEADRYGSWCLNGNHDMYSGGFGYFDCLLKELRFRKQEQRSFFSLHNKNWQILGLDTAWENNGLKDPQSGWIKDALANKQQKAILLSHHQLFSAYESGPDVGRQLAEKLGGTLEQGLVHSWFWGHEHRCVFYEPWDHVQNPRLLGHGGVPVYMSHDPKEPYAPPVAYEYRDCIEKGLEKWALFGFAVLDFDGPKVAVRYVDENGRTHYNETLE